MLGKGPEQTFLAFVFFGLCNQFKGARGFLCDEIHQWIAMSVPSRQMKSAKAKGNMLFTASGNAAKRIPCVPPKIGESTLLIFLTVVVFAEATGKSLVFAPTIGAFFWVGHQNSHQTRAKPPMTISQPQKPSSSESS